jgi:hypothetical protein
VKVSLPDRPKLTRVEARGDHYAIGAALGEAAADALREVVPAIARFKGLKTNPAAGRALDELESAARRAFPEFMREIDGIADGAGVDFKDVWLWNCRGDFVGGGDQSPAALAGCTTVMLGGSEDVPGVIGHNEDDQPELDGCCFIARVEPIDAPGFVSFYSPGLLPGHTFAVNDAGLVQTINHIRPFDQRPGIPRHIIARAVMAQSSLDDALMLLRRDHRASGFHHNLGMAGDRRLLSVEAPANGCSVEAVSNQPRVHTNHLLDESLLSNGQEIAASSRDRLQRSQALVEDGALADRDPLRILQDAGGDGLPIHRKGRHPEDSGYTLATAVFEIHRAKVGWRIYTDSETTPEHSGVVSVS